MNEAAPPPHGMPSATAHTTLLAHVWTVSRGAGLTRPSCNAEECDHLIANAKPHIRRSQVVNMESGGSMKSDVRTSGGFFYPRGYDQVTQGEALLHLARLPLLPILGSRSFACLCSACAAAIESRIASWTLINETQGEGIQVNRKIRAPASPPPPIGPDLHLQLSPA